MVAIVSIALSCTFSSYLMMNNIVTLKSRLTSFKAIGNGTILKLEYQVQFSIRIPWQLWLCLVLFSR